MGWLIALGILVLLAILPLGVSVRYNADGALVRVIAGPFRITVFPMKKKEKNNKEKPEKEALPKEKKPATAAPAKKKESGGSLLDFLPLVQVVLDFLGDFRRKLRIHRLELKLILAGDDPCDLATNYGRAWAALGNLWPKLEEWFEIRKREVEIECDFTAGETLVIARLDLSITLGRLLSLAVVYVVRALKVFLNIKNKRKGGAVQ